MTKKQEQPVIQESVYDAFLQITLKEVSDFERKIVALYCQDMPKRYIVNDPNYWGLSDVPVFMMLGTRIDSKYGFIFEAEETREEETFPEWCGAFMLNELNSEIYLGIDINKKHIPKYFEMLAKMRLAYDFSRENRADIFLPRIFCRLQKQNKTIGILTEDVSRNTPDVKIDGISEEELVEQEKIVPLRDVFCGMLERSYFRVQTYSRAVADAALTRNLLALIDVDHLEISEEYEAKYEALKKWYEQRDPFVICLDDITL